MLFSLTGVLAVPAPRRLVSSCFSAGHTETIFCAFIEGCAAAGAILGLDASEFCTAVAVRAACGAAVDRVPVYAHEALPVWIVAEVVDTFPKQSI